LRADLGKAERELTGMVAPGDGQAFLQPAVQDDGPALANRTERLSASRESRTPRRRSSLVVAARFFAAAVTPIVTR
jgi:hypothetical protein